MDPEKLVIVRQSSSHHTNGCNALWFSTGFILAVIRCLFLFYCSQAVDTHTHMSILTIRHEHLEPSVSALPFPPTAIPLSLLHPLSLSLSLLVLCVKLQHLLRVRSLTHGAVGQTLLWSGCTLQLAGSGICTSMKE